MDQFDNLNITGQAARFVKDDKVGFLKGTDDADSFNGSGVEAVHGGGGDDTIRDVHSVYHRNYPTTKVCAMGSLTGTSVSHTSI